MMKPDATIDRLFEYIVTDFAIQDDLVDIDLTATASDRGDSITSDKARTSDREMARARQLAVSFREGLLLAALQQAAGQSEICLSDQDPAENAMADAMIAYLVSYGLATSRTAAQEAGGYHYCIDVTWSALDQVAQRAGVDLTGLR